MTKIICPHCNRTGTSSKRVPLGAKVRCPGCGNSFRYADTGYGVAEENPSPAVPFSSAPPAIPIASSPPVIAPVTPHLAVAPTGDPSHQVIQMAVPERQGTNAVGIAALGLGTLAIVIAWSPVLGPLAIPVGLLGGLLGTVGLVYGVVTKRCKVLAASVGLCLSLGSIIVSVMMTGAGRAATAATEYNEKAVEHFAKLRESVRGIAAREGKMPTNEFTIEIIDEAAASKILTTEEYVAAKEAFLDYGGQYVSPTDEPETRSLSGNPYPGPSMIDQSVQVEWIRAKCFFEPIPGP